LLIGVVGLVIVLAAGIADVGLLLGARVRAATAADAAQANVLRDELAKVDAATVDVRAATSALEKLFPCP